MLCRDKELPRIILCSGVIVLFAWQIDRLYIMLLFACSYAFSITPLLHISVIDSCNLCLIIRLYSGILFIPNAHLKVPGPSTMCSNCMVAKHGL